MAKHNLLRPEHYGSESRLNATAFPDCADPEYFEAWASYITTKTAQDLFNRLPEPYGMTLTVQGFLSYLASIRSSVLIRSVKSPMSETVKMFESYIKGVRDANDYDLTRNQFLTRFRPAECHVILDSQYNRVANLINVGAWVHVVYSPAPVRGRVPKVGEILHTFKQAWFKGQEPEQLFKTDNLTKVMARSPIPNVPDTYPQVRQLFGQTSGWHPWMERQGIDIARVRGNAVAIRFYVPRTLVFLCDRKKTNMDALLVKKLKNAFS